MAKEKVSDIIAKTSGTSKVSYDPKLCEMFAPKQPSPDLEVGSTHEKTEEKKSHAELNRPKEKDPELESRTVFVGNVPKEMKKSQLKKLFSEFGSIETIRFRGAAPSKPHIIKKIAFRKKELHPDSSSIVAYIRFKTRKEAKKATKKLNGFKLEEHHITVDLADNSKKDNKKAIFIGNLHLKLADEELRSFFQECGTIRNVRVVRDSATGMGKGFGYVNFENSDSVELALKLDGGELRNRPLRIKRAVKKEKVKKSQGERQRVKFQTQSTPQKIEKITSSKVEPKKEFTGDRLAEFGKLKKHKKPNKGELKKARIAKQLTGVKVPKKGQKHRHVHHEHQRK